MQEDNIKITRITNTIYSSNMYILDVGYDQIWLIDCGDIDRVLRWGREVKKQIAGVFLTHSHFDHIYGLNELVKEFPDCIIYVSKHGEKGLFSAKLNFSFYHENPFVFKGGNVRVLEDGDDVKLQENLFLNVVSTPGHDEGCLCYRVGDYFFTGDSYIPGVKTVTKLRGGNKEDGEKSLRKLKAWFSQATLVCPGHGSMMPMKDIVEVEKMGKIIE